LLRFHFHDAIAALPAPWFFLFGRESVAMQTQDTLGQGVPVQPKPLACLPVFRTFLRRLPDWLMSPP